LETNTQYNFLVTNYTCLCGFILTFGSTESDRAIARF